MQPGSLQLSVSDPSQIVQENVTLHYTLLTSGGQLRTADKATTGSDKVYINNALHFMLFTG
jgi:hypothetical protein